MIIDISAGNRMAKDPKRKLSKEAEAIRLVGDNYVDTVTKVKENDECEELNCKSAIVKKRPDLRARLKEEHAFISQVLSFLHVPKHSKPGQDEDNELVSDVSQEVKTQMKLKLQAHIKDQRAHSEGELHHRLKRKLEELQGENFGKGKKSKKGKKSRLTKAEKKQKAKEEKRLKAKLAKKQFNGSLVAEVDKVKPSQSKKPVFNSEGKMVFSKFDFANEDASVSSSSTKRPTLDPKSALNKLQKHKEKLQSLQDIGKTERARSIVERTAWKAALDKAGGLKVKDDAMLLKKSIKRLESKKKGSKKKWEGRMEQETRRKDFKEKKRQENMNKRKQVTMQKKMRKSKSFPGFK